MVDSSHSQTSDGVVGSLLAIPRLLEGQGDLVHRGRFVTMACIVGTPSEDIVLTIEDGLVLTAEAGRRIFRPTSFSFRAEPAAWLGYWREVPPAGLHDLLALTKSGRARLEGELHPFLANLQYFKDLLALPRLSGGER